MGGRGKASRIERIDGFAVAVLDGGEDVGDRFDVRFNEGRREEEVVGDGGIAVVTGSLP